MYKTYFKLLLLAMISVFLVGITGCSTFLAPPGTSLKEKLDFHVDRTRVIKEFADAVKELKYQVKAINEFPKDRNTWTKAQKQEYASMVSNVETIIKCKKVLSAYPATENDPEPVADKLPDKVQLE